LGTAEDIRSLKERRKIKNSKRVIDGYRNLERRRVNWKSNAGKKKNFGMRRSGSTGG